MPSKLPPGPRSPRVVNLYRWMVKPTELFNSARARYGDVWTLTIPQAGSFIVVSDPKLVKDVFTAAPTVLHAGHANLSIGTSLLGAHSVLHVDELATTATPKDIPPAVSP